VRANRRRHSPSPFAAAGIARGNGEDFRERWAASHDDARAYAPVARFDASRLSTRIHLKRMAKHSSMPFDTDSAPDSLRWARFAEGTSTAAPVPAAEQKPSR